MAKVLSAWRKVSPTHSSRLSTWIAARTCVESVRWRHRDSGAEETRAIRNVFLFLGADPATGWLKDCGVAFDDKGFVTTGGGRLPLETSVPGVFAIGDVRAGSVKRVGGAIGEGAAVVAQIHAFLARESATAALVHA